KVQTKLVDLKKEAFSLAKAEEVVANSIKGLTDESTKLKSAIEKMEAGSEEFTKATEDWKKIETRLSDLKKEAFKVAEAEDAVKNSIKGLTAESSKLSSEIEKLEIGSDEYIKKTEEFKKINTRLQDIKDEVYATEKAQELLNNTFFDMVPFGPQIQQLSGGFKTLNSGVKATTLSTITFKKALASTGIGLLIIALGTLFTWLSKTQQGMDFV